MPESQRQSYSLQWPDSGILGKEGWKPLTAGSVPGSAGLHISIAKDLKRIQTPHTLFRDFRADIASTTEHENIGSRLRDMTIHIPLVSIQNF